MIEFIPHGRRTTSGPPPTPHPPLTHVMLPARLPCYTSGSCESQCCSLIQGKCQTQETVFKYLHFQRFFFPVTATFIITDQAAPQCYECKYRDCAAASNCVCKVCTYCSLTCAADVSSTLKTSSSSVHKDSQLGCVYDTVMLCVCILTLSLFA